MKTYLLINPWIYDFAAHDFGNKPIGLLRIAEYLRRQGNQVYYVDCLDGASLKKDECGFSKIRKKKISLPETLSSINRPYFRYGIETERFIEKLRQVDKPDEIFVASGMTYWYLGVQKTIGIARQLFGNVKITLGGIYATLCHEHAKSQSGADEVIRGDYLNADQIFESGFYPAFDLLKDTQALPVQLTRGCPFKCSYCGSRIINPGFVEKKAEAAFNELCFYNENFNTRNFIFYDDALIFNNSTLKSLIRLIIKNKKPFTFHALNGMHAKYVDQELADLMRFANFKELRLSLESQDKEFQIQTGAKVTTTELKRALSILQKAGFRKHELGVYLLTGIKWLDTNKTKKDAEFINSLGAKAIIASYSPIPGTKDYRDLVKTNIISADMDPLWHNKTVFSQRFIPEYVEKVKLLRRFTAKLNKQ